MVSIETGGAKESKPASVTRYVLYHSTLRWLPPSQRPRAVPPFDVIGVL